MLLHKESNAHFSAGKFQPRDISINQETFIQDAVGVSGAAVASDVGKFQWSNSMIRWLSSPIYQLGFNCCVNWLAAGKKKRFAELCSNIIPKRQKDI